MLKKYDVVTQILIDEQVAQFEAMMIEEGMSWDSVRAAHVEGAMRTAMHIEQAKSNRDTKTAREIKSVHFVIAVIPTMNLVGYFGIKKGHPFVLEDIIPVENIPPNTNVYVISSEYIKHKTMS